MESVTSFHHIDDIKGCSLRMSSAIMAIGVAIEVFLKYSVSLIYMFCVVRSQR